MEIQITREIENRLLGRKEIFFTASYSGNSTPSKEEVKEEICKKLSLKPDLTTVIKITQEYGKNSSDVSIHYYSTKEGMERLARKEKKKVEAKPAAQPSAASEKKEEQKEAKENKEEKKEEAKAPREEKKHKEEKHEAKEEKKDEAKKSE